MIDNYHREKGERNGVFNLGGRNRLVYSSSGTG